MTTICVTQSHKQLLKLLTNKLIAQGYLTPTHCRLSYESYQVEASQQTHDVVIGSRPIYVYQGLTKALYQQQWVMVKWQLAQPDFKPPTPLAIERANIKQLLSQQLPQKKAATGAQPMLSPHCTSIVPIICEHDSSMTLDTLSDNLSDNLGDNPSDNPSQGHDPSIWAYSSFTMPFITLGSVQDYFKNNILNTQPVTYAQKHALIIAIAQALEGLHHAGWIHGDIKPSNVLLASNASSDNKRVSNEQAATTHTATTHYTAWLTDLAYAQPIAKRDTLLSKDIATSPRGTPAYIAPECWQGQAISVQSDIYAFGIMLYEIVAGKHPYQAINHSCRANMANEPTDKLRAWAMAHCQAAIAPIAPTAPIAPLADKTFEDLQPIINKLLAKNRINRYQTISSVRQDLQAVGL